MGAGREPLTPLRRAVEEAYRALRVPPQGDLGVCDCCGLGPRDVRRIRATPVRQIDIHDIWSWYDSADVNLDCGKVAYLLPRIFEFLAEGACVCPLGNQLALRRVGSTGFPDQWPMKAQRAVDGFLAAFLDAMLADPEKYHEQTLDEFLCMAASANADIPALLQQLDTADGSQVARAIVNAVDGLGVIDSRGRFVDPFWENASPARQEQVSLWYRSPTLLEKVVYAFHAARDPEWQERLSVAEEIVRTWSLGESN